MWFCRRKWISLGLKRCWSEMRDNWTHNFGICCVHVVFISVSKGFSTKYVQFCEAATCTCFACVRVVLIWQCQNVTCYSWSGSCRYTYASAHTHTHLYRVGLKALFILFNFYPTDTIRLSARQSMHSRQNERGKWHTKSTRNPADRKCINCAFTMDTHKNRAQEKPVWDGKCCVCGREEERERKCEGEWLEETRLYSYDHRRPQVMQYMAFLYSIFITVYLLYGVF